MWGLLAQTRRGRIQSVKHQVPALRCLEFPEGQPEPRTRTPASVEAERFDRCSRKEKQDLARRPAAMDSGTGSNSASLLYARTNATRRAPSRCSHAAVTSAGW